MTVEPTSYVPDNGVYIILTVTGLLVIFTLCFILAQRAQIRKSGKGYRNMDFVLGVVATLAVALLVSPLIAMVSASVTASTPTDRAERLVSAVSVTYGVQLDVEQAKELLFPDVGVTNSGGVFFENQPDTAFESYGHTTALDKGRVMGIHLAWLNGEYVLLTNNTDGLTELSKAATAH